MAWCMRLAMEFLGIIIHPIHTCLICWVVKIKPSPASLSHKNSFAISVKAYISNTNVYEGQNVHRNEGKHLFVKC